jgi:hypothetical protein
MVTQLINSTKNYFTKPVSIAPLAIVRIAFGAIMLFSIIRFVLKGWVREFYVEPKFYFGFYGFEWIKPLNETGMYLVFFLLGLSALFILLGFYYRASVLTFLLSFVYVELLDKTNYLNHYYFISIFTFLLVLVPAHRYFSLDVIRKPSLKVTHVPNWTICIFKFQLLIVYLFAGIAKLNHDWLFEAMPLRLWLPANSDLPVIGPLLNQLWVAYFFSWFGAIYDLLIGFLLFNNRTRSWAYFFVVVFHVFTGWFFKIGMFPYIMILLTLIFFSEDFHRKIIKFFRRIFFSSKEDNSKIILSYSPSSRRFLVSLISFYFVLQVLLPFRYLLYPNPLFWTEDGYRFSWRVMLMDKRGTAFFYVTDLETGKRSEVMNSEFLTPSQEKMMETQADMILQYAHFLDTEYRKRGIKDPVVTVESYVTLNGSGSRLFVDSSIDLSKEKESMGSKSWILPFNNK